MPLPGMMSMSNVCFRDVIRYASCSSNAEFVVTVWLVWLSQRMAWTDHEHAVVGVTD